MAPSRNNPSVTASGTATPAVDTTEQQETLSGDAQSPADDSRNQATSKTSQSLQHDHDQEGEMPESDALIVGHLLTAIATGRLSLQHGDQSLAERHKSLTQEQRHALREVMVHYRTVVERMVQHYDSLPV